MLIIIVFDNGKKVHQRVKYFAGVKNNFLISKF